MAVGLEAIAFEVPKHFIEMDELARARGVDPAKFIGGLGQQQMSVATPCEDTVTLAAGAGLRLLRHSGIDPRSIGMVIVGTETGIDYSKPAAIYVHELLGLSVACRVFETKHACYGAMAGVSAAISWIQSGRARGRKALVIASDIARYGLKTPGEPTQGAGAVAMLISDQPTLLTLNGDNEACFARQVMDFWRPNYSKEAFADGHYSIKCYLEALEGAYALHKENAQAAGIKIATNGSPYNARYAGLLYHVPFVKMAQKAHLKLLELDAGSKFEEGSPQLAAAISDYRLRALPWTEINARIGNIYTGSVFVKLINLLEDAGKRLERLPIALFSYGSGCAAEFLEATISPGAEKKLAKTPFRSQLAARTRIDIPRYEEITVACGKADLSDIGICDPTQWNVSDQPVVYAGSRDHKRTYIKA